MPKSVDNAGSEAPIANSDYYKAADIDSVIATCPGGLPKGTLVVPQLTNEGGGEFPRMIDRRTELKEKLEYAAAWFNLEREMSAAPSPSKEVKRFGKIETCAKKLLESLGLPDNGDPDKIPQAVLSILRHQANLTGQRLDGFPNHPPIVWEMDGNSYTEYNGPAQLRDAIEGIKYLRDWSAEVKSKVAAKVAESKTAKLGLGVSKKTYKGDEPLDGLFIELAKIWVDVFEQRIRTSTKNLDSGYAGKATGPMVRYIQSCLAPLGESPTDDAVRARIKKIKELVESG